MSVALVILVLTYVRIRTDDMDNTLKWNSVIINLTFMLLV